MSIQQLKDVVSAFNRCWPQHYVAEMHPRAFTNSSTDCWVVDVEAVAYFRPIKNPSQNYIRTVAVNIGTYPDFEADTFDVSILTHSGEIKIKEEGDLDLAMSYITERMAELQQGVGFFDKVDKLYPITWEKTISVGESAIEYGITGICTVPKSILDNGTDDFCKLLVSGLTLIEHPNYIDSYLNLNKRGLITDTWSAPEKI